MSATTDTVRVAIYCRRSTPKQEDSIDRQLSSVMPYCDRKGYVVVGKPYVDDGICGDEFVKRAAFQRLLADARRGLFTVIVTDEWSRISRQKVLKFMATVAEPLDEAGVTLDTVADGPQSWDDIGQLIMSVVKAHKSQGESIDKGHRAATECLKMMREGRLLGGPCPYGLVVIREPHPRKPGKLIPVRYEPDPRTAHVVRWIFTTYAAGKMTLQEIADELNLRHVQSPPPAGRGGNRTRKKDPTRAPLWSRACLRVILHNPKYTGAYCANRQGTAKYSSVRKEGVEKLKAREQGRKPPEDWFLVPATGEPLLIDQQTFDLCQLRLEANRGGRRSGERGVYLFSGLVVCGHCGRSLVAKTQRGKLHYVCSQKDDVGKVVCDYNAVPEDTIRTKVMAALQEELLGPDNLAVLRRRAKERDDVERGQEARDTLAARLAELNSNISRGNANLALIPSDLIPGVVEQIRAWEKERDRLKGEAQRRDQGGHSDRLEQLIATREALIWEWREAEKEADPLALRRVVKAYLDRVEVNWKHESWGTRTRHRVAGGVIHFRGGSLLDNDGVP